jgi:glucose-6-phosphate-specific signal transduction histidine kinase
MNETQKKNVNELNKSKNTLNYIKITSTQKSNLKDHILDELSKKEILKEQLITDIESIRKEILQK